ncbi:unnamed protein product [Lasius platythorax]|uniref:Uncharacterized protein n=1 Tax=Lasius platythorax TaxID=488582 RepID=A0AAV2NLC3_9HYME
MININAERCVHNTDLMKKEESKINKLQPKRSYKLHSTPKDTEQDRSESTTESQRKFNDLSERSTELNNLLERNTELKAEVSKENMCFDESIFKMFENKRRILNNIFAKLNEPNGEKKTHFDQSASNKLDNSIKSPGQPVILKKYEHTEDKSCPVKMSPNNIEDQSCDSDLLTNKNWQEILK